MVHVSISDICQFDDFWLKVLQSLDTKSLISLAASCEALEDVYRRFSKRLCRFIDVESLIDFSEAEITLFVNLSGSDIKYLFGGPETANFPHFGEFIRLLSLRPTEVTDIAFVGFSLSQYQWNDFVPSYCFSMVDCVQLNACDLRDENLFHWNFLRNLKVLDLRCNDKLTGSFLQFLPPSVEALQLSGCSLLCPSQLAGLSSLPRLRELRALDLKTGGQWPVCRDLMRSCPGLKGLELSVDFPEGDEHHLVGLRRLHSLNLKAHCSSQTPTVLRDGTLMALLDVRSLRCLKFPNAVNGFISATGLDIISDMSHLLVLYIPNQSFQPESLRKLKKLVRLVKLSLSYSPYITDAIVVELVLALPSLSTLIVKQCPQLTTRLQDILLRKLAENNRPMIDLRR